ncbi:hypothetical protein MW887_008883 [Aspergillus wentii]|nr:hypothetical protein MW887_008883 [Aspergillus wentii]
MTQTEENEPFLPSPAIEEERRSSTPHNEFEIEDEELQQQQKPNLVIIYATFLGVFLSAADETLVTATYGTISSQFHSLALGSLLLTGYDFGYCVGLPVYGMLSDIYGCKAPLIWAYGLFGIGSVICGVSTSLSQLIVGRVVAGLGGAGTSSLVSVIIADIMPPSEVAVMRAWMMNISIAARSFGAPIGSFLTETVGWRWSFIGQLPLLGFCILVAAFGLPSSLNERKADEKEDESILSKIDIAGIITFAATVMSFLALVYQTGTDTNQGLFILSIGAFIISLIAFLLVEFFWAKKPLIPLNLIKGEFGGFCLVQVLLYSGRFALIPQLVPYFVRVENMSDVLASSFLVASSVGIAAGAMMAGYIIRRYHPPSLLSH